MAGGECGRTRQNDCAFNESSFRTTVQVTPKINLKCLELYLILKWRLQSNNFTVTTGKIDLNNRSAFMLPMQTLLVLK